MPRLCDVRQEDAIYLPTLQKSAETAHEIGSRRPQVDGDIADASWIDVNDALVLLERKRRAALRRAVLIFNADERARAKKTPGEGR